MQSGVEGLTNDAILDAKRLAAVERTGLTESADDRMERVCRLVARLLDVPVVLVTMIDDRRQYFPGAHGLAGELAERRETPLSQSVCRDVVDTDDFVRIDDLATDERYSDHPAGPALDIGAYLGVPLVDGAGHVLGSLCAISPAPRPWTDDDVSLLVDLALGVSADLRARIAMSIANEARVETSASHDRLQMLLRAADALSSTLETDVAVSRMLDLVVPAMAHWAAVYFAPTDGTGAGIVVRHTDAGLDGTLQEFVGTPRQDAYDPPIIRSIMRGEAPYIATPPLLRPGMPTDLVSNLERLGIGHGLAVPVTSRADILGALLLVAAPGQPAFQPSEIQIALDLAARAGMAVQNARLFEQQRAVALTLQRSLLPPLHPIDGVEIAATYRPASSGVEVGGDWYDAAAVPTDATCISIGDVTGHSIAAAAAMGKVRGALHARALDGLGPAAMLAMIDRDAAGLLGEHLATCLVGRFERDESGIVFVWSSAGHLPAAIVAPDGRVELLDRPTDMMLGVLDAPARREHRAHLAPGSRLVLYTDGLVERRDQPLDAGLDQLRAVLRDLDHGLDIEAWCKAIVDAMGTDGSDDVAVLVTLPLT